MSNFLLKQLKLFECARMFHLFIAPLHIFPVLPLNFGWPFKFVWIAIHSNSFKQVSTIEDLRVSLSMQIHSFSVLPINFGWERLTLWGRAASLSCCLFLCFCVFGFLCAFGVCLFVVALLALGLHVSLMYRRIFSPIYMTLWPTFSEAHTHSKK